MTAPTKVQKRKNLHSEAKKASSEGKTGNTETEDKPLRYGALPKISGQRIWSRGIVILGVLVFVWYTSKEKKETVLAKQKDFFNIRGQSVDCDAKYLEEIKQFPGCVPRNCGRFVSDKLVTAKEAEALLNVAKRGIALGGSDGGASILDLHSGALSYGEQFVNVYNLPEAKQFITSPDLAIYKSVKNKIQHAIAQHFGIDSTSLYLTHPTFFSKMTNVLPKTPHDEYWHVHIDKETYESFHYTSLVYLSDYDKDFKGGKFVFVDNASSGNITVEPRQGRVLMFSSGAENPHFVERVTEGVRYAITVSFTCDQTVPISDPKIH